MLWSFQQSLKCQVLSAGHQLLPFSIAFLSGTLGPGTEYPSVVVLMGEPPQVWFGWHEELVCRGGLSSAVPKAACLSRAQPCVAAPAFPGYSCLFKQVCRPR